MNREIKNCECRSVFNRLSRPDRLKLQSAALFKAITGFVREESKTHPGRYPFYAAYLVVVVTPLPFPGASTLAVLATVAWARYSKSPSAERLNGMLKDAFNDQALVCGHREFISADAKKPESYRIANLKLAWETTKQNLRDTGEATAHAWRALKKLAFG